VFITAVPITKLFARGEGDSGGHVLRETTSRGLSGLVCPSRTSERGGEGLGAALSALLVFTLTTFNIKVFTGSCLDLFFLLYTHTHTHTHTHHRRILRATQFRM
jgi:hypothetical protein